MEERLTAAEMSTRDAANTSQSNAQMVSDLERRLAASEAQGATARRAQIAAEKHVLQLQADLQQAQEQELQSKETRIALQDKLRRQQQRLDVLESNKQRKERLHADSSKVKKNLDQAVFAKLQKTLLVRPSVNTFPDALNLHEQSSHFRSLQNVKVRLIRCRKIIARLW